jgi:hypothetical protein
VDQSNSLNLLYSLLDSTLETVVMAATQCMKASFTQKSGVARSQRASAKVVCALPTFKQAATTFGTAAATLALTLSANAATVKLGADNGE